MAGPGGPATSSCDWQHGQRTSLTGDGPSLQDVASPRRHRNRPSDVPFPEPWADATPSSRPVQAELVAGPAPELAHRPPLRRRPRGRTGRRPDAIEPDLPDLLAELPGLRTVLSLHPRLKGSTARSAHQPPRLRTPLGGGGDLDDPSLLRWDHRRAAHAKVRSTRIPTTSGDANFKHMEGSPIQHGECG